MMMMVVVVATVADTVVGARHVLRCVGKERFSEWREINLSRM